MNAGDGVDKASAVVYDQVGVAVVSEGVVPLPLVGKNDGLRSDVLLD